MYYLLQALTFWETFLVYASQLDYFEGTVSLWLLVHFAEISLQQLKMILSRFYGPHVLECCLSTLGRAPNETTDGVLGYFLPDLDKSITALLDSLRCNLVAMDGPKHNVPEVFYWICVRRAWGAI